jgi:MFS family permease
VARRARRARILTEFSAAQHKGSAVAFPLTPGASAVALEAQNVSALESRASWVAAGAVLFIFTFSYGAPLAAAVALKQIAADLGSTRWVASLANSLSWLGMGVGAIGFGWLAERIGVRSITVFGALMMAAGLALSSQGGAWHLLVGHGVLIGLLGGGAINVPLIIYISQWFDRRRGSAVALVSSGQYIAGALWPPLLALGNTELGWRPTMLLAGVATALAIVPSALMFLYPAPRSPDVSHPKGSEEASVTRVRGSGTVFLLLCLAGFFCCTPMAMPPGHLAALCSDLGIPPARGALMLSVLLGTAMISRQFWGWLSDRVGGIRTILAASACQAAALVGFALTQDEAGLFAVSATFGLGVSGIIPAYVVALRQLFPANEAAWRVPTWFFCNICGMALGGWLAGYMYDELGSYAPAFAVGILCNIANLVIIAWLAAREREIVQRALPPGVLPSARN